ncbi:MAG: DUF2909 domain-containing protein, partial [Pseudomonadales bacterium]|nr:DUF2909 domain-containing protein [Pseudomonadales bacterium]
MVLKVIIVILLFANIAVLGRALFTLLVDQGRGNGRTSSLLLLRVGLALALVACVAFGLWSGQLGMGAPWHP